MTDIVEVMRTVRELLAALDTRITKLEARLDRDAREAAKTAADAQTTAKSVFPRIEFHA